MSKNDDDRLPHFPKPTAAQLAQIDEEQKKRAKLVNVASSDSSRAFARANAIIGSLKHLKRDEHTPKTFLDYVNALSTVGRFDEAYKLSKDEFFREIWNAVKGKTKPCKCKDTVTHVLENGRPKEAVYSRLFVRRKVFSVFDQRWHDLKMCNKCLRVTI